MILDDIDKDLLENKWYIARDYWKRADYKSGKRKELYIHRIILERILGRLLVRGEICDHINMDKLDNRRSNLRLANYSLNAANTTKPKTNTSGYKGVGLCRNRWMAKIKYKQKYIHIGSFGTKEEAAMAYNKKALELFGEYAHLNIIVDENV